MWKIESIEIENIVSFREAALEITPDVATLIFGRNEDNASQPCNGSGKSSLIEAISFALTGEQLRKVKSIEEIINDSCDTASVFIKLRNDYFQCDLTICRTISRKGSQVVECHKYDFGGCEIDVANTIQPTVADYNKYILREIGLSKDDIYNTFILCDNKYESFFDTSDKGKKEIINRFSNGVLVDESIARVQADMEPINAEIRVLEDRANQNKGAIAATKESILKADEKQLEAKELRERQIAEYERQIVECRESIELSKDKLKKAQSRKACLEDMQNDVKNFNTENHSLIDSYEMLKSWFDEAGVQSLSDYKSESEDLNRVLVVYQGELESENDLLDSAKKTVEGLKAELVIKNNDVESYKTQYHNWLDCGEGQELGKNQKMTIELKKKLDELERQLTAMETKNDRLEGAIANARKMISGAVKCPKCGHAFILADDCSVEDYEKKIEGLQNDIAQNKKEYNEIADRYDGTQDSIENLNKQIAKIQNANDEYKAQINNKQCMINSLQTDLNKAERELNEVNGRVSRIESSIYQVNVKISLLREKMFAQAEQLLSSRISEGVQFIRQMENNISYTESMMNTYRTNKSELEKKPISDFAATLEKNLHDYEEDLTKAMAELRQKEDELKELKTQEVNFTLFKSYLARKKIDALSLIVNDFLEKIGSDIRLRLEGFSVTKTGKLRDKISVNVMRDGVDCGSYHKFSGGEKARLNLACILSLHTLTNSNCEDGRGLDFLIIDELLDKSDEVGMATYCEALNKLGQTALLITQGAVAEGYPHKLLITKSKGTSTISH